MWQTHIWHLQFWSLRSSVYPYTFCSSLSFFIGSIALNNVWWSTNIWFSSRLSLALFKLCVCFYVYFSPRMQMYHIPQLKEMWRPGTLATGTRIMHCLRTLGVLCVLQTPMAARKHLSILACLHHPWALVMTLGIRPRFSVDTPNCIINLRNLDSSRTWFSSGPNFMIINSLYPSQPSDTFCLQHSKDDKSGWLDIATTPSLRTPSNTSLQRMTSSSKDAISISIWW